MGGSHHLDMPVVMDQASSVTTVAVGCVEHRKVLFRQVRGTFDCLPAADCIVGLDHLRSGEPQLAQQVEVGRLVLVN